MIGVPGSRLFHWACGRLVKNMARRSKGQEMDTETGQKERVEKTKTINGQERQNFPWFFIFILCYRSKGQEERGWGGRTKLGHWRRCLSYSIYFLLLGMDG